MTDVHSCSYFCDRPECIKAQRDELRERLAQPEQPTKIDVDYWVSSRSQIIEALAKAGFTLMSNANGFWLEPAPQPEQEPEHYRHTWGKDGERCVVCGDKDWMGTSCKKTSAPAQPEQEPVAWLLTDKNINALQVESIQRLIDRLKHAHHTDLCVRINGQDEWVEADWLKHMIRVTPPQRKPLTDERIGQIVEDCKITLVNYCSDEKQTEFARAIEAAHGIKENT